MSYISIYLIEQYIIGMSNKCDICNIIILADNKDTTTFDYNIKYINDNSFEFTVNIQQGESVNFIISNKYGEERIQVFMSKNENIKIITSSFRLKLETNEYIGKIPKIIHQSYTENIKPRLRNATLTWQLMNNNYKYMYWTDEDSDKFIFENCDNNTIDAYSRLYARAYKSDIFRLCILYKFGGIWTDISSECYFPLDKLITTENLVIVKDNPSQVTNGNIYQAFIAVEPNSTIIKYILDFTVDRVLKFDEYDKNFPWIHNETIAVTGPTIFAMALNNFINRNPRTIFNDKNISFNSNNILLLDHKAHEGNGYIFLANLKIVRTKYDNYQKDRTTPHYSRLFTMGYIIKDKLPTTNTSITANPNNLFQIWICGDKYSNNYVTSKMRYCNSTWREKNPEMEYIYLNNDSINNIIQNETEFPRLFDAYNKLKAFAFKADLIRYYLLYKYGGMYTDIDTYCVNPIKELISNNDLVLSYDIDKKSISQAFLYSRNPGLKLFKMLVIKSITNILDEHITDGDCGITGPVLFGKIAQSELNYLQKGNDFIIGDLKIRMINYTFHLKIPEGPWQITSNNIDIKSNILTTYCRSPSGSSIKNVVRFMPGDKLFNINGKLVGNRNVQFSFSDGSGFYIYNNKIYSVSKYDGYNDERHILGGNDFANLFQAKDVFNK